MIEPETMVWHMRELFETIKKTAFGDLGPCALTTTFPEYLPPLILPQAAEALVCRAVTTLRKCASSTDIFLASAHYEDRHDLADCCVVMSLALHRSGPQEGFSVNSAWAQDIGEITQALLCNSVALSMAASNDALAFDFRFPVHAPGFKLKGHRDAILLVEDDTFVRNASREVLEIAGYRVLEMANAEEALPAFERYRHIVCAVLSDITLPGRNGKELARALRASSPAVPIVLMSGYNAPIPEDASSRIFYLAKPFNATSLLAAIRRSLERCYQLATVEGGSHSATSRAYH